MNWDTNATTSQYQNPLTGAQQMTLPTLYGPANNPLTGLGNALGVNSGTLGSQIGNYIQNPSQYISQMLSGLGVNLGSGGSAPAPNTGQTNTLLSGLGMNLNPTLPTAPNWTPTLGLEGMANLIGEGGLTSADVLTNKGGGSSAAGVQSQIVDPTTQIMQGLMGSGVIPQMYQSTFQNLLGGAGEASGAPGSSAMATNGVGDVFNSTTLAQMLPTIAGMMQNYSAPFTNSIANLASANTANANYMSQQANSFTNDMNYQQYINAVHEAMAGQNNAAAIAQQNLGYQDSWNLNNQQQAWGMASANNPMGTLTADMLKAYFTPNQTFNSGATVGSAGGTGTPGGGGGGGGATGANNTSGFGMPTLLNQNNPNAGKLYDPKTGLWYDPGSDIPGGYNSPSGAADGGWSGGAQPGGTSIY